MQNLIAFLFRYKAFFLFVILEIISFVLIVRNNDKQKAIFLSSSNKVSGGLFERYDKIVRYWNLGEVNKQLAEDNKRLMEEREQLKKQLDAVLTDSTLNEIEIDSAIQRQYQYIPAMVVNNSVNRFNNYLTLNKGSNDGLTTNTGVVSNKGLVGIIRSVSPHYASVMSLLHRNTRISATIKGSGYFGSLIWKDQNPRFMSLEAIPKHVEIAVGDTIVTSGYSEMFPPDLMIGTVSKATLRNGNNFYEIKVKLSSDLNKIKHVFVVRNHLKEEKQALEAAATDE